MDAVHHTGGYRVTAWRVAFLIYVALFIYGFLLLHADEIRNRVLKEIWDFGHVAGFFSLSFFIYKVSRSFNRLSWKIQLISVILATVFTGFTIETIQRYTGRSFSIQDVYLDLVGAISGVLVFSVCAKINKPVLRWLLRSLVGLLLLLVSKDLILYSVDAFIANQQFPSLVACAYKSELTRFSGAKVNVEFAQIDHQKVIQAKFLPARYSTLTLDHFPHDWTEYKYAGIEIYNPEQVSSELHIRIHDYAHIGSGAYNDRYNQIALLQPGWNSVKISLTEIKNAPAEREMDMQRIHQVIFFFHRLDTNKTLYLAKVQLDR